MRWSLLIAMPIAAALDAMGAGAPLVFFCAALAIVPLAALIVHSTEHLAARTGPALGGLLNATFGNLPELIIAMAALRAGLLEMVRASLIGALLANLLLALGIAFLLGCAVPPSPSTGSSRPSWRTCWRALASRPPTRPSSPSRPTASPCPP